MTDIAGLIERVEKALGPDRELDAAIVAYLNDAMVKPYPPATDFGPHDRWQFWSLDGKHFLGSEGKFKVPEYTASIDAALALVERKLPGAAIDHMHYWPLLSGGEKPDNRHAYVTLVLFDPDGWARGGRRFSGNATTLPLAILAALLRALGSDGRGR